MGTQFWRSAITVLKTAIAHKLMSHVLGLLFTKDVEELDLL